MNNNSPVAEIDRMVMPAREHTPLFSFLGVTTRTAALVASSTLIARHHVFAT